MRRGKTRGLACRRAMLAGLASVLSVVTASAASAADTPPLQLLREPTLSAQSIVFEYGGQLWRVSRDGGAATRLVTGMDRLRAPLFSPDGQKIAFTGTYDGNTDVYVVSARGGQPQRLTYHPSEDVAVGWTPDGHSVLFRSGRHNVADPDQLYTVAIHHREGLPQALPLAEAETGSYSSDGKRLAYVPEFQWEPFWKGYKGGQYTNVWLARLADSSVERIPNPKQASDNNPMWIGNTVYFLSDRGGPVTLYAYHVDTHKTEQVLDNGGFDITSASAGPNGTIVYSQFGKLHLFDTQTGKAKALNVIARGDMPQRRDHRLVVNDEIQSAGISPTGLRAVFEAHGEAVTVPAEHGAIDNLTASPGAADREPAWSPDGKHIAYFSDAHGQYDLYIAPQDGAGKPRRIALGQDDAYYYQPTWSPDGRKLLFSDQKLNLWMVDLDAGSPKPVKIDSDRYDQLHQFNAAWSPDGRWVTYTKVLPNYLHAVFVHSLDSGKTTQVTDGGSDCLYPVFDANGQTLYFTSSTDTDLSYGWLDMTSMEQAVTRHVYAATLQADAPSPVAPQTGFENQKPADEDQPKSSENTGKAGDDKHDSKTDTASGTADDAAGKTAAQLASAKPPAVHIDLKGLQSRAVALPIAAANYVGMAAGKHGMLYLQKAPLVQTDPPADEAQGPAVAVERFDLGKRKVDELVTGVTSVAFTPDAAKMLYKKGSDWTIAKTEPQTGSDSSAADPKKLDLSAMRVAVNPSAEWRQMYHDAWRFQKAFFYDANFHGLDVNAAEKHFAPYLPGIASRDGLSFLFKEMLSYMSVGHMFIRGGHQPPSEPIKVGLLGADYTVDHGKYRFRRIFDATTWHPDMPAPLAQPGLKVKAGDYLLAVNGRSLDARTNLYKAFQDLANRQVRLRVGPNPDGSGAHTITVQTIDDEHGLRHAAWIAHNRRVVDKLSHGRLAYVYLPDTYWGGYKNFNRYFFSQVDKEGVIVDERFNHGGLLADYIIQQLKKKPMTLNVTRWGDDAVTPPEAIFGPKVMLINQFSGSGGDALPWYFKRDKIGTLVGKRTWGGLVGIGGFPTLMDGGTVTAPNTAVEGIDGTFPVENHGVSPDVEVWQDPAKLRQGIDPQLHRAIEIGLKQLEQHPTPTYKRAPSADFHPQMPPLPAPYRQPSQ